MGITNDPVVYKLSWPSRTACFSLPLFEISTIMRDGARAISTSTYRMGATICGDTPETLGIPKKIQHKQNAHP